MPRTYRVRRLDQLAALASPVRLEILEALTALPRSSVARIAGVLGRPADALYYHLRELVRVGLVLPAGRGPGAGRGRAEALFRAVAPRVAIAYDADSPGNVARVGRIAAALLRLGARDFRRAFRPGNVVVSGPRRELWVGRATGRMSGAELEKANRLLDRLTASVHSPSDRAGRRLYAATFLLVPVEPAVGRPERRAGRRRRR